MLFRLLILLGCLSFSLHVYAIDRSTQRADYQLALSALAQGDLNHFYKLSNKLQDYPLYPYLVYADLVKRIHTAPTQEIQNFLTQYNDTPLAQKLWIVWLEALAEDKEWPQFLSRYHATDNVTLQCLARQALWHTGYVQPALNGVSDIWLNSKPYPPACQMIISQWQTDGGLTLTLLWEKIYIAMTNNNIDAIRELMPYLPQNQLWIIQLYAAVFNNPLLLNEPQILDNTEPVTRFILKVGMQKLATQNADYALMTWLNLQKEYSFTATEKQIVSRILGVALASQGDPDAINWLAAAGNDNTDQSAAFWRIRIALLNQNWPAVLTAIAQLSPEQQKLAAWQYWQARALAAMGQTVNASIIYEALARQQDYYGQLATIQLGKPIVRKFQSQFVDENQLQNIANILAMQRAYELYELNYKYQAREEWQWALQKLPLNQYLYAAQLATQWGWFDNAIATNQLLGEQGDVRLRYPLAYQNNINLIAREYNLDPAWVYAEIRQESLFQTQAHSAAGALGLMQLLPNTAVLIAEKLHLYSFNEATLFNPDQNIEIGGDYLQKLLSEYHGNIVVATAAYNAGPARISRWISKQNNVPADIWVEAIPWYETRDYVKNIMASMSVYEEQLGMPVSFDKRMKKNI